MRTPPDRRRSGRHERPGPGADVGAGARPGGGRAVRHDADRARDERPAGPRGGALGLEVRAVGGDRRVRGRHRHLLRAPARERAAAAAREERSPKGYGSPSSGPSRPASARSTSSRSAARARSPDGAAHDPRVGDHAAAPRGPGRRRGQHVRRRAEDVRGPGPPRRPHAVRRLARPTCSRRSSATTRTPAARTSRRTTSST